MWIVQVFHALTMKYTSSDLVYKILAIISAIKNHIRTPMYSHVCLNSLHKGPDSRKRHLNPHTHIHTHKHTHTSTRIDRHAHTNVRNSYLCLLKTIIYEFTLTIWTVYRMQFFWHSSKLGCESGQRQSRGVFACLINSYTRSVGIRILRPGASGKSLGALRLILEGHN